MTISEHPETTHKWWKEATVYQIYPASFKDSNNDGWGDLRGISSKLGYLKNLGVDAIWVCPFYDSPQQDMGYDISDYEKVWPKYGSNKDCFELIDKTHALGMKFITDLVINHCSTEHEWFKESRSSLDNPKRDWFIWRPAKGYDKDGKPIPPNNWASFFGGSAWNFDETTKEFYLRLFTSGQPDFNWENVDFRKAIYETSIGYWLDHGVDGFRIDIAGLYSKIPGLPNIPAYDKKAIFQNADYGSLNGPRIHEFHQEINKFIKERVTDGRDILTVGEVGKGDEKTRLRYTSSSRHEISELFNFAHTDVGVSKHFRYFLEPFTLKDWKQTIADSFRFINGTDAWSTIYLENHDQPRSVTRFGDDSIKYRTLSAKLLALLETSLTGTLFIFQAQELGQINCKNWPIEKYEDVEVRTKHEILKQTYGEHSTEMQKFHQGVTLISRDHGRTPMPWSPEEPNAGFTGVNAKPWFYLNEAFREGINVEKETKDPSSVLNFWIAALKVRKAHKDIMVYGYDFEFIGLNDEKLFSFTKRYEDKTLFVVLNFSSEETEFQAPDEGGCYQFIFGNYPREKIDSKVKILKPWEGRMYYLE